jgi:hypothetical protein
MEKREMEAAVDIAEKAEEHGFEWTEAEENKMRRKLDIRIVPLLFFLFLLCFIDRLVTMPSATAHADTV